ncbi:nucleoside deaminase [Prochlorococcus marinus]|uniref:nucleoside deaminase n=1 Tax=Prochlorococcus marinus TaxID=1219 RepID=UPI0022B39910|nr:nucleoside deaminase [Prochlorococcus marinus]
MQFTKPVKLNDTQTLRWMVILLERAKNLGNEGEVPVAAIILDEKGHCIGHGRNTRNKKRDPLGHAEIVALRQAALIKNDWRFNECTMIVTLEPCQMCAGALIQARMGKVIYGAEDQKRGGLGGSIDLSTHKSAHHKMIVKGGIMNKQVKDLIESWFKQQRSKNTSF